jgi:hypothetical protein
MREAPHRGFSRPRRLLLWDLAVSSFNAVDEG